MADKLKSNLCTIYFIRHGETDWNTQRKLQGHKDISLNKSGIIQAEEVAKELKGVVFDAVYSSDLTRARQTAEIVALKHRLTVKTHKVLRERGFGKYEGMKVDQFRKEFKDLIEEQESLSDRKQLEYVMPYDNQSWDQVTSRVIAFLREISLAHPGETVLVASHGGILKHLLIKLAFFTFKQITWESISNTAYIKLESDGIDFFLKDTKGITIYED